MEINFDRENFFKMTENRPNLLLRVRPRHIPSNQENAINLFKFAKSSFNTPIKPRCLFGVPSESETQALSDEMFARERARGLSKYLFDVATGRPVQETPPNSPQIGMGACLVSRGHNVESADIQAKEAVQARGSEKENQLDSVINTCDDNVSATSSSLALAESPSSPSSSGSLKRKLFEANLHVDGEFLLLLSLRKTFSAIKSYVPNLIKHIIILLDDEFRKCHLVERIMFHLISLVVRQVHGKDHMVHSSADGG